MLKLQYEQWGKNDAMGNYQERMCVGIIHPEPSDIQNSNINPLNTSGLQAEKSSKRQSSSMKEKHSAANQQVERAANGREQKGQQRPKRERATKGQITGNDGGRGQSIASALCKRAIHTGPRGIPAKSGRNLSA
jgi:hypothetical protein